MAYVNTAYGGGTAVRPYPSSPFAPIPGGNYGGVFGSNPLLIGGNGGTMGTMGGMVNGGGLPNNTNMTGGHTNSLGSASTTYAPTVPTVAQTQGYSSVHPSAGGGGGNGDTYGGPATPSQSYGGDGTPQAHSPWGAIGGAVVAGLGTAFSHPGGDNGMAEYTGHENTDASNTDSLANQQRGRAGTEFGYLGSDEVAQRAAAAKQLEYLSQDPNTAGHNAQFLAGQQGGTTAAYLRAQAQLKNAAASSQGGSNGLGSAPSSQVQGGQNYLAATGAGAAAAAQAALFQQQQSNEQQRMQQANDILSGQVSGDYGRGQGFASSAGGLYGQGFDQWSKLYGQAAERSQAQAAAAAAPWQAAGSLLKYA